MSTLPRGTCRLCNKRVALRKGGLVREHRSERAPVCRGSGKPAKERA
jgi:hypothetical protein